MLILDRKQNEGFYIEHEEGDVYVKLLSVNKETGRAKIGIDADRRFNVRREELAPREATK